MVFPDLSSDVEKVKEARDHCDDEKKDGDEVRKICPGSWVVALCCDCGTKKGKVREQEEKIKPVR